MAAERKLGKHRVCAGALLLALAMPLAIAGPAEDHARAVDLWGKGNVPDAMALLHKLAESGHVPSQVTLADVLDQAELNESAVHWYQQAADKGDPAGEYGLGVMYGKGEGTQKDPAKALDYITRAAEKNYPRAMLSLSEYYKTGDLGLTPDLAKSEMWLARAQEFLPKEEPKPAPKKSDKKKKN